MLYKNSPSVQLPWMGKFVIERDQKHFLYISAVKLGIFTWGTMGFDSLLEPASSGHWRNSSYWLFCIGFIFSALEVAAWDRLNMEEKKSNETGEFPGCVYPLHDIWKYKPKNKDPSIRATSKSIIILNGGRKPKLTWGVLRDSTMDTWEVYVAFSGLTLLPWNRKNKDINIITDIRKRSLR